MFVPREDERLLCVCVCRSSTVISKQVGMGGGKTRAKEIRSYSQLTAKPIINIGINVRRKMQDFNQRKL